MQRIDRYFGASGHRGVGRGRPARGDQPAAGRGVRLAGLRHPLPDESFEISVLRHHPSPANPFPSSPLGRRAVHDNDIRRRGVPPFASATAGWGRPIENRRNRTPNSMLREPPDQNRRSPPGSCRAPRRTTWLASTGVLAAASRMRNCRVPSIPCGRSGRKCVVDDVGAHRASNWKGPRLRCRARRAQRRRPCSRRSVLADRPQPLP